MGPSTPHRLEPDERLSSCEAQSLVDVGKSSLLGIGDLNAAKTQEAPFFCRLGDLLTDVLPASLGALASTRCNDAGYAGMEGYEVCCSLKARLDPRAP
jgi:hypothetical protein